MAISLAIAGSVLEAQDLPTRGAVTVVPNRNAIMLSIACGVARRAALVACAMHAGDHYVYPDCRPAFVEAFDTMERLAVEGISDPSLRLYAPFVKKTKAESGPP